jgi:hypothetical protein
MTHAQELRCIAHHRMRKGLTENMSKLLFNFASFTTETTGSRGVILFMLNFKRELLHYIIYTRKCKIILFILLIAESWCTSYVYI